MSETQDKNIDRRSFLKWSMLSWPAFAVTLAGCGSALMGKDRSETVFRLKCGPVVETDCTLGGHCRLIADQNFVLSNPQNALDGHRMVWEIIQDEVGGRAMNLGDKFVFGADLTQVELTSTPHKRDFFTAIYNSFTDRWYVVAFIKGY